MGNEQLRAVIFTQDGANLVGRLAECHAYADQRGYELVATVTGDGTGAKFAQAMAMLRDGRAHIMVVHGLDDLPPGRLPRIEVATLAPRPGRHRSRRPRRLRSD